MNSSEEKNSQKESRENENPLYKTGKNNLVVVEFIKYVISFLDNHE